MSVLNSPATDTTGSAVSVTAVVSSALTIPNNPNTRIDEVIRVFILRVFI
jgi:hypothetical protein